jgi:hypothetical protein
MPDPNYGEWGKCRQKVRQNSGKSAGDTAVLLATAMPPDSAAATYAAYGLAHPEADIPLHDFVKEFHQHDGTLKRLRGLGLESAATSQVQNSWVNAWHNINHKTPRTSVIAAAALAAMHRTVAPRTIAPQPVRHLSWWERFIQLIRRCLRMIGLLPMERRPEPVPVPVSAPYAEPPQADHAGAALDSVPQAALLGHGEFRQLADQIKLQLKAVWVQYHRIARTHRERENFWTKGGEVHVQRPRLSAPTDTETTPQPRRNWWQRWFGRPAQAPAPQFCGPVLDLMLETIPRDPRLVSEVHSWALNCYLESVMITDALAEFKAAVDDQVSGAEELVTEVSEISTDHDYVTTRQWPQCTADLVKRLGEAKAMNKTLREQIDAFRLARKAIVH